MDHFDRSSTTLFWAIQTNLHNRITDRQTARQMTDRRTDHATHTTLCLKKIPTYKLSVTLLNLNRFSKNLHCWKTYEIFYKIHATLPTSP